MRRIEIEFDEFKTNFIDHAKGGFYNVYSVINEENDDGEITEEALRVVNLDMICEWRLDDGKIKFMAVKFKTKEELDQIKDYLRLTADLLNKAILEEVENLQFKEVEDFK